MVLPSLLNIYIHIRTIHNFVWDPLDIHGTFYAVHVYLNSINILNRGSENVLKQISHLSESLTIIGIEFVHIKMLLLKNKVCSYT